MILCLTEVHKWEDFYYVRAIKSSCMKVEEKSRMTDY